MDTSDSKIRFGPDGVCDHCQTFYAQVLPSWDTGERGRSTLERIAAEIKEQGVGRDFDCIIGVSGGIDSSYLTYVAKTQLGLRPLVFHVDAGWNSQIAVNNIEKLVDGLGLDLYTEVIDWEEMRDLQLAFFKSGVPHIDRRFGTRRLFSRYMLRRYQAYIGPGRLVESLFQYSRSNGGGVSPFR